MDWLHDQRTDCWSYITSMSVQDYLGLVEEVHGDQGGISGQREVLKTTTAKRIRSRMVEDIVEGTVLPPVVIGVLCDGAHFRELPIEDNERFSRFVNESGEERLSIIDGMQRTEAIRHACDLDDAVKEREVRVEFWFARSISSLIYRMLVLNTGQVPWTLSRQLAVVYSPLVKEIRDNVTEVDRLFDPNTGGRRVAAGQYSASDVVELYIAFSLRKTNIDAKEALSEEFSRLDFIDNLSTDEFQPLFYRVLSLLARFDRAFSRYESAESNRFSKGRDVFTAQPARVGFVVAIGLTVLGRPGLDKSNEERGRKIEAIEQSANTLIDHLNYLPEDDLGDFLRLDVLSEILDKRVGQVGRYERSVFYEAFKTLIEENFNLANMEPCWRAN